MGRGCLPVMTSFVHTTRLTTNIGYSYNCECVISRYVHKYVTAGEADQDIIFIAGVQCPHYNSHCRFFREEITPRSEQPPKNELGIGRK